jgi:hypothetical protein
MDQAGHKHQYDVVSLTRVGQEKRTNFVSSAANMSKTQKPTGQFVSLFSDMFRKVEYSKKNIV